MLRASWDLRLPRPFLGFLGPLHLLPPLLFGPSVPLLVSGPQLRSALFVTVTTFIMARKE